MRQVTDPDLTTNPSPQTLPENTRRRHPRAGRVAHAKARDRVRHVKHRRHKRDATETAGDCRRRVCGICAECGDYR